MMKKIVLLVLQSIVYLGLVSAQDKTDFEGLVRFRHKMLSKNSNAQADLAYSMLGYNSDYYFKKGNIKWLTYDCFYKMDLFKPKDDKDYFLTSQSDTIFTVKNSTTDFDVLEYRLEKSADTIMGYVCDVFIMKLKPKQSETPISYRRYYFSSKFYVDPKYFTNCNSNRYDLIFSQIQSIPLRIEFEWSDTMMIWEATQITPQILDDNFFQLDKKSKFGYW